MIEGVRKRVKTSVWKWRLVKYGPLLISVALLAVSIAGVVAAESYTPYRIPRHM